jgi:hypothetical protein
VILCSRCAGRMYAGRDHAGAYAYCLVCGAQVHLHPRTGEPEPPWGRIVNMPQPRMKGSPRHAT